LLSSVFLGDSNFFFDDIFFLVFSIFFSAAFSLFVFNSSINLSVISILSNNLTLGDKMATFIPTVPGLVSALDLALSTSLAGSPTFFRYPWENLHFFALSPGSFPEYPPSYRQWIRLP